MTVPLLLTTRYRVKVQKRNTKPFKVQQISISELKNGFWMLGVIMMIGRIEYRRFNRLNLHQIC